MAKLLLVDGHSAIFSYPPLAQLHQSRPRAARQELENLLRTYQDTAQVNVVLVFDGKQTTQNHQALAEEEILVIYSPRNASADSVIERIVAKQAKQHDILVASNDRAVGETCAALGAFSLSISSLFELLEGEGERFRQRWGL